MGSRFGVLGMTGFGGGRSVFASTRYDVLTYVLCLG